MSRLIAKGFGNIGRLREVLLAGVPQALDFRLGDFKTRAGQPFAHNFYGLAAPAVAAENGGFLVLKLQFFQEINPPADGDKSVAYGGEPTEMALT